MSIPNVKYYYQINTNIPGSVWIGNSSCSLSPTVPNFNTNYRRSALISLVRQRPKPPILLPTNGVYTENQTETGSGYGCSTVSNPGVSSGSGGHLAAHYGESSFSRNRPVKSSDIASARLKSFNRLNRTSSSFGESFGQLSQTGHMVARRTRQIAEAALLLKQGNFRGLASLLKGDIPGSVTKLSASRRLADGWLELEFGWKPLVQDIYTAISAYRDSLVAGQLANSRGNSAQGGFGKRGMSLENRFNKITRDGLNVSSKLYATVSNPTLATMNELGLVNPALTAWQLLPFSFVVDAVIPVSAALSSLTSKLGYSVIAEMLVTEETTGAQYKCGVPHGASRIVRRTLTLNPSVPSVPFMLNIRANSIWHAWTAAALLKQRFGR